MSGPLTAVERLAPRGSRVRSSLVVGATVARELVDYASRTRWRWRLARAPSSREPDYAQWLEAHRLSVDEVKRQRHRIRVGAIGIGVDCLILSGDNDAPLSRTLRSLESQTLPNWLATVFGGSRTTHLRDARITPAGGDESGMLARMLTSGDPRRFIVVLKAGD
ncbi:MAG: hypothetical protein JOZ73_06355, partial [Solirubrobacterales bacterium]|nr:hypothetical protein [Solirubrobacterales bacterium]